MTFHEFLFHLRAALLGAVLMGLLILASTAFAAAGTHANTMDDLGLQFGLGLGFIGLAVGAIFFAWGEAPGDRRKEG